MGKALVVETGGPPTGVEAGGAGAVAAEVGTGRVVEGFAGGGSGRGCDASGAGASTGVGAGCGGAAMASITASICCVSNVDVRKNSTNAGPKRAVLL